MKENFLKRKLGKKKLSQDFFKKKFFYFWFLIFRKNFPLFFEKIFQVNFLLSKKLQVCKNHFLFLLNWFFLLGKTKPKRVYKEEMPFILSKTTSCCKRIEKTLRSLIIQFFYELAGFFIIFFLHKIWCDDKFYLINLSKKSANLLKQKENAKDQIQRDSIGERD